MIPLWGWKQTVHWMMPRRDWKQAVHWVVANRFKRVINKWFKAPKGRTAIAQGNALGTRPIRNPALKGRNIVRRIIRMLANHVAPSGLGNVRTQIPRATSWERGLGR